MVLFRYGVSRHDLFSQIDRTKRDVDKNDWLPDDFKFTQTVKTSNNEGNDRYGETILEKIWILVLTLGTNCTM